MFFIVFALVLLTTVATTEATAESQLALGKAINLFVRYGYFSISMRVLPRNETSWIFREPTLNVFKNIEQLSTPKEIPLHDGFHGDFHMEFCDNLNQLLQAYFREFEFERLSKPWRAFTAGWVADTTARQLGINSSFVYGDHCYVLVRIARFRESAELDGPLPPELPLQDYVSEGTKKLKVGDSASADEFFKRYGSHYISSYVTGNSLYQVFVYKKSKYYQIKQRLKSKGVLNLFDVELLNYFSPWYVEHMGTIKCASGNSTVEQWALNKLKLQYYIFKYPSLLKLHTHGALLHTLDDLLGNEALLQLELKALTPVFKDPVKKYWFEEIIDNNINLWEINM